MRRAKNLEDSDIEKIVGILDSWSGVLTWNLLIDAVDRRIYARYTRQALHMHARIRDAFSQRKRSPAESPVKHKRVSNPALQASLERVERLEAENERLKLENTNLLEQFVRWAYNANAKGLDIAYLSQPLPPVNRGQSRQLSSTRLKRVKKD